jgi:hypothetical protein
MGTPLFVFSPELLRRRFCLADWRLALTAPRAADPPRQQAVCLDTPYGRRQPILGWRIIQQ